MWNKLKKGLRLVMISTVFLACEQSDPPVPTPIEEKGDIRFSGYEWYIKSTENPVGPGPNIFSKSKDNVWLDANGYLHLRITNEQGVWKCAEVISTLEMGYGTYVWTIASDLTTMDDQEVLGLFTWDTYSLLTQANSEVDIEFSRWGSKTDTTLLTTSVQPVWSTSTGYAAERSRKAVLAQSKLKTTSTHAFTWTKDSIVWSSYVGDRYPGTERIDHWKFDLNNPPRSKVKGGKTSAPIIIPAPGDSTNARMNLWLLVGDPPAGGQEFEVVIKSFQYHAL